MMENDATCKQNITDILKVFELPEPSTNNDTRIDMAATNCKIYCASERSCWGCLMVCKKNCKSNAIRNCEKRNGAKHSVDQSVSQKPGINGKNFMYTIFLK